MRRIARFHCKWRPTKGLPIQAAGEKIAGVGQEIAIQAMIASHTASKTIETIKKIFCLRVGAGRNSPGGSATCFCFDERRWLIDGKLFLRRWHELEVADESFVEVEQVVEIFAAVLLCFPHLADFDQVENDIANVTRTANSPAAEHGLGH
jgi:hypothetical protein